MSSFENKNLESSQNDSGNESFGVSEFGEFSFEQVNELHNIEQLEGISLQIENLKGEIEKRKNELEGGLKESIETIAGGSGLSLEEIEMAKRNSGLIGRMNSWMSRVNITIEKYVQKITKIKALVKGATLIISATIALGASIGDTNKAYAEMSHGDMKSNSTRELSGGLQQDISQQLTIEQLGIDPSEAISIAKDDVLKIIKSKKFLKKLQEEFGCSEDAEYGCSMEDAKDIQMRRIRDIQEAEYKIFPKQVLNSIGGLLEEGKDSRTAEEMVNQGKHFKEGSANAFAYKSRKHNEKFMYFSDEIFSTLSFSDAIVVMRHEIAHMAAMFFLGEQSKTAERIMESSAVNMGNFDSEFFNYLSEDEERSAYFKNAQLTLIELGIWKYGEPFTTEHYDKVIEEYNKGNLPMGTQTFFESTKEKEFIEMFNNTNSK